MHGNKIRKTAPITRIGLVAVTTILAAATTVLAAPNNRQFRNLSRPPNQVPVDIQTKLTNTYLFSPDYLGQKIHVRYIASVPATQAALINQDVDYTQIATPNCNPNSVAATPTRLYVACNKDAGKPERILVYNWTSSIAKNQVFPVSKTITSPEFNQLMALAIDSSGNLWASNYGNSKIVRISSASLATAAPKVDRALANSPGQPVGITFDPRDNSLWVVGSYSGGIVLNIPATELAKTGLNIDATPRYCISKAAAGCPQAPASFDFPEGIAVVGSQIFFSNNGGDHPAYTVIKLGVVGGQLAVQQTIGTAVGQPFSCPGGLFAHGNSVYVNDQSLGLQNTGCGSNDGLAGVDGVIRFSAVVSRAAIAPRIWKKSTSRPGFGGIAVITVP
jgi:hypothetical protein